MGVGSSSSHYYASGSESKYCYRGDGVLFVEDFSEFGGVAGVLAFSRPDFERNDGFGVVIPEFLGIAVCRG